jgi:hypothetical protein
VEQIPAVGALTTACTRPLRALNPSARNRA